MFLGPFSIQCTSLACDADDEDAAADPVAFLNSTCGIFGDIQCYQLKLPETR